MERQKQAFSIRRRFCDALEPAGTLSNRQTCRTVANCEPFVAIASHGLEIGLRNPPIFVPENDAPDPLHQESPFE
jgi:hypothetical protein